MSNDPDDLFRPLPYDVGYKKPPKNHRFAKGKSGNPRGRPPKKRPDPKSPLDKSTTEAILKIASREVKVRDGEIITKIPVVDAVIQTMATAAMKGSVPAQRVFVELVHRARKDQAAAIRDDHAFWRDYVVNYDKYCATLLKAGEPLPEHMAHADDLVFEEGSFVMLRGGDPAIAAQNRNLMIRFIDVLFLQSEQDRRCHPHIERPVRDTSIFVSDYLAILTNSFLPKRMQLSDNQILLRLSKIAAFPKNYLNGNSKQAGRISAFHTSAVR